MKYSQHKKFFINPTLFTFLIILQYPKEKLNLNFFETRYSLTHEYMDIGKKSRKLTEVLMNNLLLLKTSLAYIVLLAVSKLFKVLQIINKTLTVTKYFLILLQCKITSEGNTVSWIISAWVSWRTQSYFIVSSKLVIEKLNVSLRD